MIEQSTCICQDCTVISGTVSLQIECHSVLDNEAGGSYGSVILHLHTYYLVFSAAKAALDMQMSVSQSVSQSVRKTFIFVRFTSIFYNSKSYRNKT